MVNDETATMVQNETGDQNQPGGNTPEAEQLPQPSHYPQRLSYRTILILAVIAICFLGIFNRDFWTPDEPRVTAISLEMSRSGNLIIPQLADKPFIEKPPLYFIAAAGLIHTLGPLVGNIGATRATSLIFALLTLLVTFLLAKRLYGRAFAVSTLIILGTMVGFVENFHWIRVDPALTFFVIAALWGFAEAYFGDRGRMLLPAGFCVAGAFLSKGPIGPAMIAIPWAGLFLIWLWQRRKAERKNRFLVREHLLSGAIFLILSGSWIIMLRIIGGAELWHEWFWINQIGRLNGTAVGLGHLRPGKPHYYLVTFVMYTLPWLPLVPIWLAQLGKRLWQERSISKEDLFLLIWGIGTIIFLSVSVTKRSIYLYPAIPAYAMMAALALKQSTKRWFALYCTGWSILGAVLMALWSIIPILSGFFKGSIPEPAFNFISTFGPPQIVAGVGLLLCLGLILGRRKIDPVFRFAAVTALIYIFAFTGPLLAVDRAKSMKHSIQTFAAQIPDDEKARVAGWDFSETMRANFYYYCDWSVPQIENEERLQAILQHKDKDYDSIIVSKARSLEKLLKSPFKVITEANPRHSRKLKKKIFWVKGVAAETDSAVKKDHHDTESSITKEPNHKTEKSSAIEVTPEPENNESHKHHENNQENHKE